MEKLRAKPYESVTITSPTDKQTFRGAVVNINAAVSMTPALQARFGHKVRLLFDGQAVGEPGVRRTFTLAGVDRGAHTLQAAVLAADGQVLARSPTSTFFVHKPSIR